MNDTEDVFPDELDGEDAIRSQRDGFSRRDSHAVSAYQHLEHATNALYEIEDRVRSEMGRGNTHIDVEYVLWAVRQTRIVFVRLALVTVGEAIQRGAWFDDIDDVVVRS